MKKNQPKVTICPSGFCSNEYKPDLATRIAQAKAAAVQPALMSIASTVPADYFARLDRSEVAK